MVKSTTFSFVSHPRPSVGVSKNNLVGNIYMLKRWGQSLSGRASPLCAYTASPLLDPEPTSDPTDSCNLISVLSFSHAEITELTQWQTVRLENAPK